MHPKFAFCTQRDLFLSYGGAIGSDSWMLFIEPMNSLSITWLRKNKLEK